jgi:hypothetical protein
MIGLAKHLCEKWKHQANMKILQNGKTITFITDIEIEKK